MESVSAWYSRGETKTAGRDQRWMNVEFLRLLLTKMHDVSGEIWNHTGGDSERCANPSVLNRSRSNHSAANCCDHCRMDGYALKRVKALLAKVGVMRFHELMDKV